MAPVSSAPTITRLSQSHRRWGETKPTRKNRRPQGTTFSYTLNVAAKVTFAFTQSAGGRKVNGRCLPQTRANKRKPSCRRTVSRGSIPANGRAGKNTLYFAGGIPHRGKLAPGTYTVAVTATAGGKTSKRQSLTFTIVK